MWQVDTGGASTGAWVYQVNLGAPDRATADRVRRLCLRRAIVAWDPSATIALPARLAGAATPAWADTAIAIPDTIEQVATVRMADAYERHRELA